MSFQAHVEGLLLRKAAEGAAPMTNVKATASTVAGPEAGQLIRDLREGLSYSKLVSFLGGRLGLVCRGMHFTKAQARLQSNARWRAVKLATYIVQTEADQ